ncbi:hypothetical protein G3I13_01870 [Streptomyces sp. SID6673]|nr:hypothetical protein [Streptomyces sp. SID11726]NDZ94908.1 hypothetical protein [Streptomyces sp. SID11726]NEB23068.1 hypothetical protein [Streptomyces sp. SID6673]
MKRPVLATLLAFPCALALVACGGGSDGPSGESYALEDGVSVTVQAPDGWQAHHDAEQGLVWLTPADDQRNLRELNSAIDRARRGEDPTGANFLIVATRDQCEGDGDWQWSEQVTTLENYRAGEVRRRADDGEKCVGVHAYDTPGGASTGPQSTDLLTNATEGTIVTGATNG